VINWRVLSTRATETCFGIIERDHEDRINSSAPAVGVGSLEEVLVRAFAVVDDNDF